MSEELKPDITVAPSTFPKDRKGNARLMFDLMLAHKWWREKYKDSEKYPDFTLSQLKEYAEKLMKEIEARGFKTPQFEDNMFSKYVWGDDLEILTQDTVSLEKTFFVQPNKPKYRLMDLSELKEEKQFEYPILVQKKYDGFQAQLHHEGGKGVCNGTIYSGRGKKKDHQFTKICVQVCQAIPENSVVDSEALMYEGEQPLHRSMIIGYADSNEYRPEDEKKCIFEIYDVLFWKGDDVRSRPLVERLKLLSQIKETKNMKYMHGEDNVIVTKESDLASAVSKVSKIKGSEGAMIKVLDSDYTKDPQNKFWAKIKKKHEVDAMVVGKHVVQPGTYNYFTVAGPYQEKCGAVILENKPDKAWKGSGGKVYAHLGGTFNTSVEAKNGDIIRISVAEVNTKDVDGCLTFGLFHPKVLMNITDEKKTPDSIDTLSKLAQSTLPKLPESEKQCMKNEMLARGSEAHHPLLAGYDEDLKPWVNNAVKEELGKEVYDRVMRHMTVFLQNVVKPDVTWDQAVGEGLKAEHEGMSPKDVQEYEGRLGNLERRLKEQEKTIGLPSPVAEGGGQPAINIRRSMDNPTDSATVLSKSATDEAKLLKIGMDAEIDAITLYSELKTESNSSEVKALMDHVNKQEKEHYQEFRDLRQSFLTGEVSKSTAHLGTTDDPAVFKTLDEEYKVIAKAGQRLPDRFYKFKPKKSSLKWVLDEHKPGKVTGEGKETDVPELPSHGETGFKKSPIWVHCNTHNVDYPNRASCPLCMKSQIILKFRDHLDLRMEVNQDGVIWQGYTPHPAQDPTAWDVFKQRMKEHRQVQCAAKSPCTVEGCMKWLEIGKEGWHEIPSGEPGATTIRTGLIKMQAHGTYEFGVQRENLHEYFFKGAIEGKVVLRRLKIGEKVEWYFIYPEDQMPLKPWEHNDTDNWRIVGAEEPKKFNPQPTDLNPGLPPQMSPRTLASKQGQPVHADTEFVPDAFIHEFAKDMNSILASCQDGNRSKNEALNDARAMIDALTNRLVESAKNRLSRKLKVDVGDLPIELKNRLKRSALEYLDDFKAILEELK